MKLLTSIIFIAAGVAPLYSQERAHARNKVVVDDDGTVHVPAQTVPMSSFLSPEAKAYVTQHLKDMQNPQALASDNGVPRFMTGYLERRRSSIRWTGRTPKLPACTRMSTPRRPGYPW